MKQLDKSLDQTPTKKEILLMVELRQRNLQAFTELQHLNDTGDFKYVHPLTRGHSERSKLERMKKDSPEQFMNLYKNCLDNIRRYRSFLKRADRKANRSSDRDNLTKYLDKSNLFKSILTDNGENNRDI